MRQVNSARVNVRAVPGRSWKYARFEHVVPELRAQGECVSLYCVFVFAFQIKIFISKYLTNVRHISAAIDWYLWNVTSVPEVFISLYCDVHFRWLMNYVNN